MNRKTRLIIAVIVTLVLAVAATTVWAGSKEGSLGKKIHDARGICNGATVNMGDATFTMTAAGQEICDFEVTRLKIPNSAMGGAPEGLKFRSDGFKVTGPTGRVGMLTVCFAYSPQDEAKNAQIYALFGSQQTILPGVKTGPPTQLCAATDILSGIFALVGRP